MKYFITLAITMLAGFGLWYIHQDANKVRYVGVSTLMSKPITDRCKDWSQSACGINLYNCDMPSVQYMCLDNVAIVETKILE